jgi:hypothetical protein
MIMLDDARYNIDLGLSSIVINLLFLYEQVRTMPLVTEAELSLARQQHEQAVVEHAIAVNEAIARAEVDEPDDTYAPVQQPPPPVAAQPSATAAEQQAPAAPSSGALPPVTSSSLGALPPITGSRGGNAGTSLMLSSMTAQEMDKAEKKRAKALEKERREAEQALLLKKAQEHTPPSEVLHTHARARAHTHTHTHTHTHIHTHFNVY